MYLRDIKLCDSVFEESYGVVLTVPASSGP